MAYYIMNCVSKTSIFMVNTICLVCYYILYEQLGINFTDKFKGLCYGSRLYYRIDVLVHILYYLAA